jgi:hypothetical protein
MERFYFKSLLKRIASVAIGFLIACLAIGFVTMLFPKQPQSQMAAVLPIGNILHYTFNSPGVLTETGTLSESSSPYWWLNSGGKMVMEGFVGKTIQGNLPTLDIWRLRYFIANPQDTDNGYHPQNILRLVTKNTAGNQRVEALFKIEKDNWSKSPNRNASNGLLLMNRYVDGNNLYYAGLRVDGTAIIKKKFDGSYYTMAQKEIFPGSYVEGGTTNLIPHREWIGLRVENREQKDGSILISLFMQRNGQSTWTKILEAVDNTSSYGGQAIVEKGHSGIRTDFMDVSFESFKFEALP